MKRLGHILARLIKRWTSPSPKAWRTVTNVSLGVAVAAGVAANFTPVGWVTTTLTLISSFATGISLSGKLTIQ